jgi:hypothetical protein
MKKNNSKARRGLKRNAKNLRRKARKSNKEHYMMKLIRQKNKLDGKNIELSDEAKESLQRALEESISENIGGMESK